MIGKIALIAIFVLLVWGNIVAGLKVGLACPDWPLCHGKVLPPFRWDIFFEFMHRVIGAATSIILIILCYKRFRTYIGWAKLIPLVLVFLLIFQIVLGGLVVLFKLPVDLTTFHFGNAILIFLLTLYMAFFDGIKRRTAFNFHGKGFPFFLLGFVVFLQAVLGAYVRHSESGLACPDFPTCLGYWIPPDLKGIVLNHFAHRVLGYLIFVISASILYLSYSSLDFKSVRKNSTFIFFLIVFQILLGVLVVYSRLNFGVTALHLSFALLILSISFYTWFQQMLPTRV